MPTRWVSLYRLTGRWTDLDVDIRAGIHTLGAVWSDTFYVTSAAGGPITDEEHRHEIEGAAARLEPVTEPEGPCHPDGLHLWSRRKRSTSLPSSRSAFRTESSSTREVLGVGGVRAGHVPSSVASSPGHELAELALMADPGGLEHAGVDVGAEHRRRPGHQAERRPGRRDRRGIGRYRPHNDAVGTLWRSLRCAALPRCRSAPRSRRGEAQS